MKSNSICFQFQVKKSSHSSDRRNANFPLSDMLMSLDSNPSLGSSGTSSYPLQHMGSTGNPIAQAASQAIAATQQLTGRRTSSLKASFEAINHMQTHEFGLGREAIPGTSSSSSQASFGLDPGLDGPPPSKKKKSTKSTDQVLDVVSSGLLSDSLIEPGMTSDLLSADLRDQDWNFDPNEPRYCICDQVSYGDMVACDNEDVSISLLTL